MCGRFALTHETELIIRHFETNNLPSILPRYNVAPSQSILALHKGTKGRQWSFLKWGLIPSWSKDSDIGNKLINAKAETLREKPSFREALKKRRCLIPASGFYEWQKQGKERQPYYFIGNEGELFAMAGLWESWKSSNGQVIESCTIVTTEANKTVAPLHSRMPVILSSDSYDLWLDGDEDCLEKIIIPYPAQKMKAYPVNKVVNNAAYDAEDCLEEVSAIGLQTALDLDL